MTQTTETLTDTANTLHVILSEAAEINRLEEEAETLLEKSLTEILPNDTGAKLVANLRRTRNDIRSETISAVQAGVRQAILVEYFGAMTVGALAEAASKLPADTPIMLPARPDMSEYHSTKRAFEMREEPHPASPWPGSWRGCYYDAALSCETDRTWTAAEFSEKLSASKGLKMEGYKGGEFPIYDSTTLWVSEDGESALHLVSGLGEDGLIITQTLDDYPSVTLEAYRKFRNGTVAIGWREDPCMVSLR